MPTLAAGDALAECLRSLETQTYRDFDVIVVDNSVAHLVDRFVKPRTGNRQPAQRRLWSRHQSRLPGLYGPYLAALNDDAVADPNWLAMLGHER